MKKTKIATVVALVLAGGVFAGSATGRHAENTCVAAVIHHEEHAEGPDGVSRGATYHDRFQRCGDHVYMARIRSDRFGAPRRPHDAHVPSDLLALPRRLTRLPDGTAALSILDAEHGRVIDVGRASFAAMHLDPSFDRAFALVDPRGVAAMPPVSVSKKTESHGPAHHGDAQWRSRVDGSKYERVLWSDQRGIALAVQSGNLDGSVREEIKVELEAGDATLPPASWRAAEHLPHVDLADVAK